MEEYSQYRERIEAVDSLTEDGIREYVSALNAYRAVAVPVFDSLDNNGQVALGYTIMEEFFYLLFHFKSNLIQLRLSKGGNNKKQVYRYFSIPNNSFKMSLVAPA